MNKLITTSSVNTVTCTETSSQAPLRKSGSPRFHFYLVFVDFFVLQKQPYIVVYTSVGKLIAGRICHVWHIERNERKNTLRIESRMSAVLVMPLARPRARSPALVGCKSAVICYEVLASGPPPFYRSSSLATHAVAGAVFNLHIRHLHSHRSAPRVPLKLSLKYLVLTHRRPGPSSHERGLHSSNKCIDAEPLHFV